MELLPTLPTRFRTITRAVAAVRFQGARASAAFAFAPCPLIINRPPNFDQGRAGIRSLQLSARILFLDTPARVLAAFMSAAATGPATPCTRPHRAALKLSQSSAVHGAVSSVANNTHAARVPGPYPYVRTAAPSSASHGCPSRRSPSASHGNPPPASRTDTPARATDCCASR
jgi:hypothetical protein